MDGLRAGRVWVDHGGLIAGLDVRVRKAGDRRTAAPRSAARSRPARLARSSWSSTIDLATLPNWAQFVPKLARVDVIAGTVTGTGRRQGHVHRAEHQGGEVVRGRHGQRQVTFTYDLGRVDSPFYVRVRGTDGNRTAPGYLGAAVDPAGPAMDVVGDADPWNDLWFYTNPIWVETH